ncbi:ATP-binding protein [Lacihabitans sp. LS3-19]|uniref:sensor histidine kinase n=1 Tax=Lacihabitans sp. LS3-19 TaxID=2487335 RepID=UPI0020CBFFE3|nr:ATP-binding protein [Lacihabitans sp. LS3-19]
MIKKPTIKTIFVSAIIILLALTFLSYFRIKNLSESASWVNHTKNVEITLEKIYINILELESSHKGYILSKDSVYLNSLEIRNAELDINLDLLQNLIKDNRGQVKRLSEIRNLIAKNRTFFRGLTKKSQSSDISPLVWIEGKKILDVLKNRILEMTLEEDKLGDKRISIFVQASFLTPFFTFILVIVSISSLIVAYVKIISDLKASEKLKIRLENKSNDIAVSSEKLALQNIEIKRRAADFLLANSELAFQNDEKEQRAAELRLANTELAFQNAEKEKRAAELSAANIELAFQNEEKEKRAEELRIANTELAFQNEEKEKRAEELTLANKELAFQNEEKENQAIELKAANKELDAFVYVSSHDLQEPLRKIQIFGGRILEKEAEVLSETGKDYFNRMLDAANRMQTLIEDLLAFSRLNTEERIFEETNVNQIIEEVRTELWETIEEKQAQIEVEGFCTLKIIPFQFRQLVANLMTNSLKFSKPKIAPIIKIKFEDGENLPIVERNKMQKKKFCHISFSDNGIGFEPEYKDKIFEVFQRLHGKEVYSGTGIGLAIVKKIVENHKGFIFAKGVLGEGSQFDIYLPA